MGLTTSQPLLEQQFTLPPDILIAVSVHFNIREMTSLASVNRRLRQMVKSELLARAHGNITNFIPTERLPTFFATLDATQSVIGGSIALAMVIPSLFANGPPTNLNVFAPTGMLKDWQTYLNNIGLVYLTETPGFDETSSRTVTFASHNDGIKSKNTVVVCEAKGTSCLTPIMSSRYTCQMTFFTGNHIYCMHPHFTPQLKTLQITQDINNKHRAQTARLIDQGFVLIKPEEEVKLCADNILCRAVVRVVGRRPHRAIQTPAEMIGFLSWGTDNEDFLRRKRVQFSLGGICERYNCINQPDFDRT